MPYPVPGTGGATVRKTHRCPSSRNLHDNGGDKKVNNRSQSAATAKDTDTTE